ncbi:GNAT family N-acetyltransferase [Paenibacillus sp. XY044]|uniref:GNAT family N-acetyltransferase n=1 Tax=Paenibacillus sp. XY044 TaxID=2026089 RepID=UPI000B984C38|nr:GNAT family protein [Paenibacillus sp. XY044]OZB93004.1 RimJ/RimL family protein N-acetyltransferase [Paenibacillus sp. XY044]
MLKGNSVYLRALTIQDAEGSLRMQAENRAFFEQFSMPRDSEYYTLAGQLARIRAQEESREQDLEYSFGVFRLEGDRLIGSMNLFQVLRGGLQSAFIGYFLDRAENGKGYMTEAVRLIVDYAFAELKLHRIEAGVMPRNPGSIRVLEKAGFHREGIARSNVLINGKWEDHQVLAIINPED